MVFGTDSQGVRTHRRGRRRKKTERKLPVAPWIVITLVAVVALSGMTVGYVWLLGQDCGSTERITVLAAPSIHGTLDDLGREWEGTDPRIDGTCIGVTVERGDSAEVAFALSADWDPRANGPQPDVWVPESRAWLQVAASRESAVRIIPQEPPSLTVSPTVIAMPQPLAEALGWDAAGDEDGEPAGGQPSWSRLMELAGDDWADYGHDEWGDFGLAMPNPRTSTAGLHALLAVADEDADGETDEEGLADVIGLHDTVSHSEESSAALVEALAADDAEEQPWEYASAFPALEAEVAAYNTDYSPAVPLTPVYPSGGSIDADYPFTVLSNVPWSDDFDRQIGTAFAEFLAGEAAGDTFAAAGFRDPNDRTGADALSDDIGESRPMPQPQTVTNILASWQAASQPMNVLIALDTSESMGVATGDGEPTRLQVAQEALDQVVGMFGDNASVGLWQFSELRGPAGEPYGEVVPIDTVESGQRDALHNGVAELWPSGNSGLYETAVAAYSEVQGGFVEGAQNFVVLITDGPDDGLPGWIGYDEMVSQLADASADRSTPVRLTTVGYGPDADAEALQAIADATQGSYVPVEEYGRIGDQLLAALFVQQ